MKQAMETVWRERAHRLSRRLDSAEARRDAWPVMVLGIGAERYGIDLPDVAEVLAPIQITPVPGAAALIAGVINVHGEIRPVIDLRQFLRIEALKETSLARVILLRQGDRQIGLRIDSVEQIRWISSGDLQTAGITSGGTSPHVSTRIKASTKDLLMLLSTPALFAELGSSEPNKGVTI